MLWLSVPTWGRFVMGLGVRPRKRERTLSDKDLLSSYDACLLDLNVKTSPNLLEYVNEDAPVVPFAVTKFSVPPEMVSDRYWW